MNLSQQKHLIEYKIIPKLIGRSVIKEGLIITHPINVAYSILTKLGFDVEFIRDPFGRPYITINGEPVVSSLEVLVPIDAPHYKAMDLFIRTINNLGYFVSYASDSYTGDTIDFKTIKKPGNKGMLIKTVIEAKYDIEVMVDKLPDTLYYCTTPTAYNKIKKVGLVPKSQSKLSYHPERVYLGTSIDVILQLQDQFTDLKTDDEDPTIILAVKVHNIPRFRAFIDPNAPEAIYTYSNIHPKYIELVKK